MPYMLPWELTAERRGRRKGKLEGRLEGKLEGIEVGKAQGIEIKAKETARNLLEMGLDIDKIVKATGLKKEVVEKLRGRDN